MNVSPEDFTIIVSLDLEAIKFKLMHKGWSQERAESAEGEYRRFLYLMKKYPNEMTAPSMEVDKFWHQHILDTRKYADDCQAVFGYFLHHYPYLGLGGEEDAALRVDAGQRMHELYEQTFGSADSTAMKASTMGYATGAMRELSAAAYCTVPVPESSTAAYCTIPSPKAFATAYCTVPVPMPATTTPRRGASAPAYCTVPVPSSENRSVSGAERYATAGTARANRSLRLVMSAH